MSNDEILVRVLTSAAPAGPPAPLVGDQAETQALGKVAKATKDVALRTADLAQDIGEITSSIGKILEGQEESHDAANRRFRLDSFTVGLAINAAGKVVLVGELGVEASIQVTFKRAGE